MSRNRVITDCEQLHIYPYSEVDNNPEFVASGSITLKIQHKFQIRQTSIDQQTGFVQHYHTTRLSVTISKELQRLCNHEFTKHWVDNMFYTMGINPDATESIDIRRTAIVLTSVDMARNTMSRGLKQFGLMVDINLITTKEVIREREELDSIMMELKEQELRWMCLRSMEERKLRKNPSLKRSHFDGGGENGDMKNCVVCLEDFEIGVELQVWLVHICFMKSVFLVG